MTIKRQICLNSKEAIVASFIYIKTNSFPPFSQSKSEFNMIPRSLWPLFLLVVSWFLASSSTAAPMKALGKKGPPTGNRPAKMVFAAPVDVIPDPDNGASIPPSSSTPMNALGPRNSPVGNRPEAVRMTSPVQGVSRTR